MGRTLYNRGRAQRRRRSPSPSKQDKANAYVCRCTGAGTDTRAQTQEGGSGAGSSRGEYTRQADGCVRSRKAPAVLVYAGARGCRGTTKRAGGRHSVADAAGRAIRATHRSLTNPSPRCLRASPVRVYYSAGRRRVTEVESLSKRCQWAAGRGGAVHCGRTRCRCLSGWWRCRCLLGAKRGASLRGME